MKIAINDKQKLLSSVAIQRAEKKVLTAFSKFGINVKELELTVQDINGPKGGIDKKCRIHVKLRKANDILVNVMDVSLSRAISGAIVRSARSVARHIGRNGTTSERSSRLGLHGQG